LKEITMQLKDTRQAAKTVEPAVIAAIRARRSIREFTSAPVAPSDLEAIVEAATFAPSAMNEQPWLFTILTDKALLSHISKAAKAHALEQFAEESHFDHARQMLSDPKFDIFYSAPALIVVSAPAALPWAVEDCTLAAQTLMLAAHGLGLGTCWIGFAQQWLNTEEGRKAIKLPEGHLAVAPLIVGHPKGQPHDAARRKPYMRWIGET
jgi:nitroreductase